MSTIALLGNKGGAGKTTLAFNLAVGFAQKESVLIIDIDPQGSSLQWSAIMDESKNFSVIEGDEDLAATISNEGHKYDRIVIDCPPSIHTQETQAALRVSDVALVPVQPSPVDLWATVHISEAIDEARKDNTNLYAALVINQLEARTTLSKLVRKALAELELPVMETAIRRRAVYRSSPLEGKSVFDMGRRGAAAAEEIDQLMSEVMTYER